MITLAQAFGKDATIDETVASRPKLVIDLINLADNTTTDGEITNGTGLDDPTLITSVNADQYASKILAGLLKLHLQKQPATQTETDASYVNDNISRLATTINGVSLLRFGVTTFFIVPDNTTFDPDLLA